VKPDIINPQSRDDQIIFTITKFIHKKPVIWKDPGDLHFFLDSYLKKKSLYLRLYFFAAKKTDYIYTLNEEDVELIKKMTCSNNVVAISSDILFEDYNLTAEPLYKKSLIVGFIGRIEASKNLETLIKAMDLIYKDIECWIIGDGSDKKRLMNLASENSKIKFFKRTNDISKFYNTFDIFVQPAVVEGWGRNVKEAMYFGIPVIGANVGGIKKQVINGKTGYLFNPADVKELAVKINTLCNNESIRKKIGIAGKKKVLADGDFRNVVKNEIIPLYETALKKKS
jgi:glycosyltransferase involved in cell wall biosynthesis